MTDIEFNKIFPYDTPRAGQRELIEQIINAFNNKKHIILNAPTGWGKSVIAYSILSYFKTGYILTSQKCLQEQYYKDLNIPYILGKSNYMCSKNSKLTCNMGVCRNSYIDGCKNNCTYKIYKNIAFNSNITNMNYNYFLTINSTASLQNKTDNNIPFRNMIVLDECHNLENELIKMCSLQITNNTLHELGIKEQIPDTALDEDNIYAWLFNIIAPRMREQYIYYRNQIIQYNAFHISREFKKVGYKLDNLGRYLTMIKEISAQRKLNQRMIITKSNDKLEFKLLYADKLFSRYIESFANKFLHMSATILDKNTYCKNLGLNENETEYISVDAIFPEKNRLIHYSPVGSLTYKNKKETLPKLIKKVELILKKYPSNKGIIHTGNYNIAEAIMNELSYTNSGKRLIMPRGSTRQNMLDMFYKSSDPLVLISPSLTEGLDLKDDLSRFCIICKVPYMNLSDSWVKARMENNNNWYLTNAAQTLVQMTGRSIRSETDYCDTYILDGNFLDFARNVINILPNWWKNAVID